jgi:uncharacterized protein YktB (UPF0637 family)
MEFPGFQPADFELFSVPDFAGRMGAIRAQLRPKLAALGQDLNAPIQEAVALPTHPHVAQHMRRRVNPPVETWVAFARDRRGYKRWTHYRVAVSGDGVRVTVFVEDDADDKAPFGANLARQSKKLASELGKVPGLKWYTLDLEGKASAAQLAAAGERLQRVKMLKFQAGVPLSPEEALKLSPEQFEEWALRQVAALKPLYVAGCSAK